MSFALSPRQFIQSWMGYTAYTAISPVCAYKIPEEGHSDPSNIHRIYNITNDWHNICQLLTFWWIFWGCFHTPTNYIQMRPKRWRVLWMTSLIRVCPSLTFDWKNRAGALIMDHNNNMSSYSHTAVIQYCEIKAITHSHDFVTDTKQTNSK